MRINSSFFLWCFIAVIGFGIFCLFNSQQSFKIETTLSTQQKTNIKSQKPKESLFIDENLNKELPEKVNHESTKEIIKPTNEINNNTNQQPIVVHEIINTDEVWHENKKR